jgi:protein-tyrosine phosphatase
MLHLGQIVPNVYVGSCLSSTDEIDELTRTPITAVLNLQTDDDFNLENIDWPRLAEHYRQVHVEVVRIEVRGPGVLQVKLADCLDAICNLLGNGRVVLVHCTEGKNRSPTVVIAYLQRVLGWDLDDAVRHVKSKWPMSDPYLEVLTQSENDGPRSTPTSAGGSAS